MQSLWAPSLGQGWGGPQPVWEETVTKEPQGEFPYLSDTRESQGGDTKARSDPAGGWGGVGRGPANAKALMPGATLSQIPGSSTPGHKAD